MPTVANSGESLTKSGDQLAVQCIRPSVESAHAVHTNHVNRKAIDSLRSKFMLHVETTGDAYDDCDISSVRNSDWTVERFLLSHKGNEELAFKALCEALEWRKSFGVNVRSDQYFPDDFYKIGGLFQYNCDKNGYMLLYFRICVHHKTSELVRYVKEFFVHNVNKIDQLSGRLQWAMIFDCTNGGIANVDMDMAGYMVHVLQNYFPKGFKYVLIYEMPWIMAAFWKITRALISEEVRDLIHLANRDEIFNYIDPEMVPQYMSGGQCRKSIHHVPDGVKRAEDLPHLGFTTAQIERFRTIFKVPLEEANREEQNMISEDENVNITNGISVSTEIADNNSQHNLNTRTMS